MSEAQTIADLAVKAGAEPKVVVTPSGRTFLVTPDGHEAKEVTQANAVPPILPGQIEQTVTLQTVDSLVDYVNRFKGEDTLLFADIASNSIVALIDYHGHDKPAHVLHSAKLSLPYSEEWRTWTQADKRLVPQLEFARFLEENAADVAAPSGADLLEACRDLHAVRRVNFKKAVRTATDNESFEYTDETEARTAGGLELPTKFLLRLPVYFDHATTDLYAFLRWKLDDGSLSLGIALHRAEHVRQAIFRQIVQDVASRTDRGAVFGRPN